MPGILGLSQRSRAAALECCGLGHSSLEGSSSVLFQEGAVVVRETGRQSAGGPSSNFVGGQLGFVNMQM